ncbi:hypothetical protein PVAG01_07964 [Phlyctema vagabunda]|uniref:Phytanoyl-CoA dioxygenase n=1 Tax=Phlyctema vagabunda TaxID=108571 RepID=A0ABR4PDY0_9HELO
MPTSTDYSLTEAQKAHFLEHGYLKLSGCFSRADAESFTSEMWDRLGMSPTDKSTWTTERTNMPFHKEVLISEFAPKAWSAMCELLGGEDRISEDKRSWNDGFIVNLGKEEYNGDDELNFRELNGWHNDGDFFIHFLDSPEQALLVTPLFSDIEPKCGGTVINGDGIRSIAKFMYDHPEGVTPWMKSLSDPKGTAADVSYWNNLAKNPEETREENFIEATGEVGDVYLFHPLMMHTASKNLRRKIRVITNPALSLKEPFNFDRQDKSQYSLVELMTLNVLGKPEGLKGWKIKGQRGGFVPERIARMEEMKRLELERLQKKGHA